MLDICKYKVEHMYEMTNRSKGKEMGDQDLAKKQMKQV